jgi:hypothetical protein
VDPLLLRLRGVVLNWLCTGTALLTLPDRKSCISIAKPGRLTCRNTQLHVSANCRLSESVSCCEGAQRDIASCRPAVGAKYENCRRSNCVAGNPGSQKRRPCHWQTFRTLKFAAVTANPPLGDGLRILSYGPCNGRRMRVKPGARDTTYSYAVKNAYAYSP